MDDFDNVWGAPTATPAAATSPATSLGAPSPTPSTSNPPPRPVHRQPSYASELDVWGATPDPVSQPQPQVAGPGAVPSTDEDDDEIGGDIGSSLDPPRIPPQPQPPPSTAISPSPPPITYSPSAVSLAKDLIDSVPVASLSDPISGPLAASTTLSDPDNDASNDTFSDALDDNASDALSNGIDDDDDFGEMGAAGDGADDDFGDFGEFDEAGFESAPAVGAGVGLGASAGTGVLDEEEGFRTPGPTSAGFTGLNWDSDEPPPKPLDLSRTDTTHILPQTSSIISAVFPRATSSLTGEPDRQIEGLGQILVTPGSRSLYSQLVTPPETRPVDWKRSKTRREHLTTLGVPIDLDEIAPSAKPLASLVLPPLSTAGLSPGSGPQSAPVLSGTSSSTGQNFERLTSGPSASATSAGARVRIDREKAERLLEMTRDNLTLQTLPKLKEIKAGLEALTNSASAALTNALQERENHAQDSETYNRVIQDLVTTARQIKSGTTVKRAGTPTRPASLGPGGWKRAGSPAPGASSLGHGSSPPGLANSGVAVPVRSMSGDRRFSVR